MKTLYLDLSMGAAGDMLTAALLELLPDKNAFTDRLNSLGIPKVHFTAEPSLKCGITGTHMSVTVDGEEEHEHHHHHHEHEHSHEHHHGEHEHHHEHEHTHHHHTSLHDIEDIVSQLDVSDKVKADVLAVYTLIAEAESHAHGKPVTEIHFHEVGTLDAVADVTAVCLLIEELGVTDIKASPVHVGSGHVHCAHGVLPVPAPATAHILRDTPTYGGRIDGELCTPTGAALLKHFVKSFGEMPIMRTSAIGCGMGRKDFEQANCVRAFLGETEDKIEAMLELSCNLDDMTPEDIASACEILLASGANDVWTVPVGMKKGRQGTLLGMICPESRRNEFVRLIFRHTSTIGIREKKLTRYILDRREESTETEYGTVRVKCSEGYGVTRRKYEHDDLARIAKEQNMSIEELRQHLEGK